MPRQLPADCLNEIFEKLEDKTSLYSCLLVNRLWSEVSVGILWRNVWNYNTLINCLPKESKEALYKNEIIMNPSYSKPLFNYVSFIRRLSIDEIFRKIANILRNYYPLAQQILIDIKCVVIIEELFKMLMSRISLKKLNIRSNIIPNFLFFFYPGAINSFKYLSAFGCCSDICPEYFYQLSQMCHNVELLSITLKPVISDGLTDLISVQQNLKSIKIYQSYKCKSLTRIIPFLAKHSNTLTKVNINGVYDESLLFLVNSINLQELVLYHYNDFFEDFKTLQHITFPQLRVLKFKHQHINQDYFIKFLENNGKNLEEYYGINNNTINLSIGKFCSNLKLLCTTFMRNESEALIVILSNCHLLEGIKVLCGNYYLNESELLEVVAKHSPKPFYKLTLFYAYKSLSKLLPKELKSFFTSWKDRTPQKSLNFAINTRHAMNNLDFKKENMNVIEKFVKLGVIKKFSMLD